MRVSALSRCPLYFFLASFSPSKNKTTKTGERPVRIGTRGHVGRKAGDVRVQLVAGRGIPLPSLFPVHSGDGPPTPARCQRGARREHAGVVSGRHYPSSGGVPVAGRSGDGGWGREGGRGCCSASGQREAAAAAIAAGGGGGRGGETGATATATSAAAEATAEAAAAAAGGGGAAAAAAAAAEAAEAGGATAGATPATTTSTTTAAAEAASCQRCPGAVQRASGPVRTHD